MADDIAFAEDGTMAWTAFLLGKVYIRRGNKTVEVTGMSGPNSLAFGKDGRLYVSEVFLGDALYEVDLRQLRQARLQGPAAKASCARSPEKLGGPERLRDQPRRRLPVQDRCGSRARRSRSISRTAPSR
jgi:sugar lactone lactonase YvrE